MDAVRGADLTQRHNAGLVLAKEAREGGPGKRSPAIKSTAHNPLLLLETVFSQD